jgi:anti-sigma regulatory factor (Ser/Thr protein kinase)
MRRMNDVVNALEVSERYDLGELQSSREWVIPSNLNQIQPLVAEVLAELGERPDLGAVELALHEALTNAISHGNRESICKPVSVTLAHPSRGSVVLVVKDRGAGFDTNEVPEPVGDRLMNERGRGIFLMRHLVARLDFVYDQGTEVRLWLMPLHSVHPDFRSAGCNLSSW